MGNALLTKVYSLLILKLKRAPYFLLTFLKLQLFLTLISWPILLCWGLPLSLASPLGNLLFTPFLMLFLTFSSLIFITELFYIPNSFLIWCLEHVSNSWYSLLLLADRSWLLRCAQPSYFFIGLMIVSSLIIIESKKYSKTPISTFLLGLVLSISGLYIYFTVDCTSTVTPIKYRQNQLLLITHGYKNILIDPGYLATTACASNWITYTLVPLLTKKGIKKIDSLVAFKPSTSVFQALTVLTKKIPVLEIFIPSWKGALNHKGWQAWETLLTTSKRYSTRLIQLNKEIVTVLPIAEDRSLIVAPTTHIIKKNKLAYPAYTLNGSIDNQNIHITTIDLPSAG
jgi:hypothetical protein